MRRTVWVVLRRFVALEVQGERADALGSNTVRRARGSLQGNDRFRASTEQTGPCPSESSR